MIRIMAILSMAIAVVNGSVGIVRPGLADRPRKPLSTENPRSKGCRLEISLHQVTPRRPPRTSFRLGESISLDIEFLNAADHAVVIFLGGSFWMNHLIEVRDVQGQQPPLTELGERCRKLFSPDGAHDRGRAFAIKAGARHGCGNDADLANLFQLKPGKYRVRVIYDEQHPPGILRCNSNWVDFEVEPRQAPEAPERGCRLDISMPKENLQPGEPIPINIITWNSDDRAIIIWECGFWFNHILEVRDARGKQPPLTDLGQKCLSLFSHDFRDKNRPIFLEPGRQHGRDGTIADLSQYFRLGQGEYRIRLTYEDKDESGVNMRKCASNWVDFRVK